MEEYRGFFVLVATATIPNLSFDKGDFVAWNSSPGDCDGPWDGRVRRWYACKDIYDAVWFRSAKEAEGFAADQLHRYPNGGNFAVQHFVIYRHG